MQRIPSLLQKLTDLSRHPEHCSAIDVDLMLDYTRVLYADLLEWRARMSPVSPVSKPVAKEAEPTLAEMTADSAGANAQIIAPVAGAAPAPAPTAEVQHSQEAVSVYAQPPAAAPQHLRRYLGINDRYRFIGELFNGDSKAFEDALDTLSAMPAQKDAMKWIAERLWIREEHSATAQDFYDILHRYFAERDSS